MCILCKTIGIVGQDTNKNKYLKGIKKEQIKDKIEIITEERYVITTRLFDMLSSSFKW